MFEQEEIFKNYIEKLKTKILDWPGEKILLYGAGEHSEAVLKKINWGKANFLGFANREERRKVNELLGYPVYNPKQIPETGATKIVISSFSFQEEIYRDLTNMKLPGVEIVKLYTDRDFVSLIKKKYAFCPKNGGIRSGLIENREKYIVPVENSKSPKILLVQVPFPVGNHRHKKILPMNLLYLAGYAIKENPNAMIRVLDGQVHDLALSEMKSLIAQECWDIIGIGYWTGQASAAFELSKFIKEKTRSLLVHGGVHPTLCTEEAAECCDIVVRGEGEETFAEIIRLFPEKEEIFKIPGLAFHASNGLKINTPRPPIKNLDDVPFPAYNLIPNINIYDSPMHVTGGLRLPLIGSRGCPYTCTFCSSPLIWDKKVRWRSASNIVDEMEEVIRSYNITQFHFWDDNIMLKRRYIEELCEEIKKRKMKINWCGLTRASHINKFKGILPLMKEAGCVGIEIGIESFTEQSIELVRKGEGIQEMIDASRNMEKAGIAPLYTHMLFNPGENINGYQEKQKFLDEVNKKNTAFLADSRLGQASTPHRTTKFEQEAKEQGEVFLKDHSTYVHHRINFIPFSLLGDIPVKTGNGKESPAKFLEIILQALHDWDETMIDQYVAVSEKLWKKIDGKKTVRHLCEEIEKEMALDDYRSKVFVCLSIVGLAREGSLMSKH